jgi:hypothetical protein
MPASNERREAVSLNGKSKNVKNEPVNRSYSEAGGVRLPQNDDGVHATSGSSKRKRRPRKLAGNTKEDNAAASTQAATQNSERMGPKHGTIAVEVEALKSKVKEIEAQVQEILLRPAAQQASTKSARRRARHQKALASNPIEIEQDAGISDHDAISSGAHAELGRLQKELQQAQDELSSLKATKSSSPKSEYVSHDEEDVEDIPRLHGPGLEMLRPRPLGRAITLSGSYRIPIPVDVSDADFDAISKGIRSAQNVARSFIESENTQRREMPAQESSSGSWSEWFGRYSMSIAKAVDSMRITSNIETVPKRPAIGARSETAPPRRRPQKLEMRGKNRPEMPDAQRRLSETQVAGLLA